MMIYLVHTIKEFENNTINTDFVIEAESEDQIKKLMSTYRVIVLGIKKVEGRPNAGQFFGVLQDNNNTTFNFCLKGESIQDVCRRCINLEIPLININDKLQPISDEESRALIQSYHIAKQNEEKEKQQKINAAEQKQKDMIDDTKKERIMLVITETLDDINRIESEQTNNPQFIEKKKEVRELKEELTKIKMGSNIEKATTILEETFALLEVIEMANITQLKEAEEKIMLASSVSNIDIIAELEKIKRAQQAEQAGTAKSSSDIYYTYLGIVGLYQKFLLKDIVHNIKEFNKVLNSIIHYLGFGILCISTALGGLFLYHSFNNNANSHLFLAMISVGIIGILRAPLQTKTTSFILASIYIIIAIILSIFIQTTLLTNLALI